MRNNILTIGLIIIFLMVLVPVFLLFTKKNAPALVNPIGKITAQATQTPTPSPSPTPQTFSFDSSTNLKAQLNSVDSSVEDNNIDNLKTIIQSLK